MIIFCLGEWASGNSIKQSIFLLYFIRFLLARLASHLKAHPGMEAWTAAEPTPLSVDVPALGLEVFRTKRVFTFFRDFHTSLPKCNV